MNNIAKYGLDILNNVQALSLVGSRSNLILANNTMVPLIIAAIE